MIAKLTGKLAHSSSDGCIIDVGGVGYQVLISLTTQAELPVVGNEISLHIHTYVREDQLLLFGFINVTEKTLFRHLISISGVGPKLAMAILSGLQAPDLIEAISHAKIETLTGIPGIGKKTAERMIIELKDKLIHLRTTTQDRPENGAILHYEDICSALTNLGYPRMVAEKALKKIEGIDTMALPQAIRLALRELARP